MKTKHVSMGALAFIFAVFFSAASAQPPKEETPAVKVVYLGKNDDQSIFRLLVENVSGEDCLISLKDETGTTIYSEKFSTALYNKKFYIEEPLIESGELILSISLRKTGAVQKFVINKKFTTTEEVVVKKES
jgi:hypothetical protein